MSCRRRLGRLGRFCVLIDSTGSKSAGVSSGASCENPRRGNLSGIFLFINRLRKRVAHTAHINLQDAALLVAAAGGRSIQVDKDLGPGRHQNTECKRVSCPTSHDYSGLFIVEGVSSSRVDAGSTLDGLG